ncbi:MAG: hypothetical protein ACI8YD_002648, partial [Rheinheimera aquimaris]
MKLTTEQFDALALELDTLKLQVKQQIGETDARYIRSVLLCQR